jgi:hypothetical protein
MIITMIIMFMPVASGSVVTSTFMFSTVLLHVLLCLNSSVDGGKLKSSGAHLYVASQSHLSSTSNLIHDR